MNTRTMARDDVLPATIDHARNLATDLSANMLIIEEDGGDSRRIRVFREGYENTDAFEAFDSVILARVYADGSFDYED